MDQPTLYQIQATITHHFSDHHCTSATKTIQIPTFYLNPNIQGITTTEQAEQIAREIILPVDLDYDSVTVYVEAQPVKL